MASDKLLKFYKGTSANNAAVGSIWFDTTNRVIRVRIANNGVDTDWQSYSGLQNASWIEDKQILRLVKADGTNLDVNLSDVASASDVNDKLSGITNRLSELESFKNTALETTIPGIQDRLDATEDVADGAAAKLEGITGTVVGYVGDQFTTFTTNTFKPVADAVDAIKDENVERDKTLGDIATWQGEEANRISSAINTKLASDELKGSDTAGDLVSVKVESAGGKVTNVEVTDTKLTTALSDITGDIETLDSKFDEKIGTPIGVTGVNAYSKDYSVAKDINEVRKAAAAAQDAIDAFLNGAQIGKDAVVDTLTEIMHFLEGEGGAVQTLIDDVSTNKDAIADLQGYVNLEEGETVKGLINSAKEAILGTDIADTDKKTIAAINDELERLASLTGTTGVSSQIAAALEQPLERLGLAEDAIEDLEKAIDAMDYRDQDAASGKYVSKVTQENGVITVEHTAFENLTSTPKGTSADNLVSVEVSQGANGKLTGVVVTSAAAAKQALDAVVTDIAENVKPAIKALQDAWLWEEFA